MATGWVEVKRVCWRESSQRAKKSVKDPKGVAVSVSKKQKLRRRRGVDHEQRMIEE